MILMIGSIGFTTSTIGRSFLSMRLVFRSSIRSFTAITHIPIRTTMRVILTMGTATVAGLAMDMGPIARA